MQAESPSQAGVIIQSLSDDLQRILAVMYNGSLSGVKWFSGTDISRTLREEAGISLHWRTIDKLLAESQRLVVRRKRQRRWEYYLLAGGEELVRFQESPIRLVDPVNAVQETVSLHDFLERLSGSISVCDPYLDATTLEHLDSCSSNASLRLLTHQVRDSGKLQRLVAALKVAKVGLEIRIVSAATLHDRYIIDDVGMIILGTSLNGFGKKQHFVIQAGEDVRAAMLDKFDEMWNTASPWP
jgi:hypothetical protein